MGIVLAIVLIVVLMIVFGYRKDDSNEIEDYLSNDRYYFSCYRFGSGYCVEVYEKGEYVDKFLLPLDWKAIIYNYKAKYESSA